MKQRLTKPLSFSIVLLVLLAITSSALAHPVQIGPEDLLSSWFPPGAGNTGDNPNSNSGHIARNALQQGEYIWRDSRRDSRVVATAAITEDVDLRVFRTTADKDNLYFYLRVENVSNNSGNLAPEFQIAIDTTRNAAGRTTLVNPSASASTPISTSVNSAAAWEFLVQTNFQQGNQSAPRIHNTAGPISNSGMAGYIRTSGDDIAEINVPWNKLGGLGANGRTLRFSVVTLYSNGTDTAVPVASGSKVMDTINPTQNAQTDVADGTLGYYFDVTFDANGEVVSPLLISEVMPNPIGEDAPGPTNQATNSEWIEIYNASGSVVNLSDYKIGDAAQRGSASESMYRFKAGQSIPPGGTVIVTRERDRFAAAYPSVPTNLILSLENNDLTKYVEWASGDAVGSGNFFLSNGPEEEQVLLLDGRDTIVDVVNYADLSVALETYPGIKPIPIEGVVPEDASYERCGAARDTNDNSFDFVLNLNTPNHTPGVACSSNTELSIFKTGPATAALYNQAVDNKFNYVLTYSNTGPNANDVYITDTLPAGVVYVSEQHSEPDATSPIEFLGLDGTGTMLTWRVPRLFNDGATHQITITALIDNTRVDLVGQQVTNNVTIGATGVVDNTPADNVASTTALVNNQPQSDVRIAKDRVTPLPAFYQGREAVYTITYSNTGDLAAAGVVVADTVPAGLTFVASSPAPTSQAGNVLSYDIGTMPSAARGTIVLTFTIDASAGTPLENLATISTTPSLETVDGAANNTASNITTVSATPPADLALTKTADKAEVRVGEEIAYTLTITNRGGSPANSISIDDLLPAGLQYVSGSAGAVGDPTVATENGRERLTWTALSNFTVNPNGTNSFTFRVRVAQVDAGDILVNTATAGAAGDENTIDNTDESNGTTVLPTYFIYLPVVQK